MQYKKSTQINEYIKYFCLQDNSVLFDDSCRNALKNISEQFGELRSHETIMEINLKSMEKNGDYSIRIDIDEKNIPVKEYWLELDYDLYSKGKIVSPCCFIDVSFLVPDSDNNNFYENILPDFCGTERAEKLSPILRKTVSAIKGYTDSLYQLGKMSGRGENDRLRVFTSSMTRESIIDFLKILDWKGDTSALDDFLKFSEIFALKKKFILDFDIFADSISEKIGINFGVVSQNTEKFLNLLEESDMCLNGKAEAVCKWLKTPPNAFPFIQNSISHFKFPFSDGKIIKAKAYLRQTDFRTDLQYRRYFAPVMMNLELTTECPLHCPQCYLIPGAKHLSVDKALYWINQAAECGIRFINLSGGETLCYPHLDIIIKKCSELSLSSAVALSGAYATRKKLENIIKNGINDIYISLNGSTEEINSLTRDGFSLAIKALEILNELCFENIMINWVMHSVNADDFENMIALCENYHVKKLVVIGFKPDSRNMLGGYPNYEQLKAVADIIKKYDGSVDIEVESCFSQLRTLVMNGYLLNRNTGIERGCGAGRDGISVNVDGKLTPCRHLDIPEDFDSITQYWENSEILRNLCTIEDRRGEPCRNCKLSKYCLPCADIGRKLYSNIFSGISDCPILKNNINNYEDNLILVDYDDNETGCAKKSEVHKKGLLHRAFSVFLFNGDKLLIQKRAKGKYHSGGLWTNTCCSHPRKNESLEKAVKRRLKEECSISVEVYEIGSFIYKKDFSENLSEYEFDHVFIGEYSGDFFPDINEAEDMKYVSVNEIKSELSSCPEKFTSWFITAFDMAYRAYQRRLNK